MLCNVARFSNEEETSISCSDDLHSATQFSEPDSSGKMEDQVVSWTPFDDDYMCSLEDFIDEFNRLEFQKKETEREKPVLCKRLENSERQNHLLYKNQEKYETKRNQALANEAKTSDKNSALMRQSKGMHTDEVDDDRVQTQLVTTKLELAETLESKDLLMNENLKLKKRIAKVQLDLQEARSTVKDVKEKYARNIGEIKRKLAEDMASKEDLENDLALAIAEKSAVQMRFLESQSKPPKKQGSLYFPANRERSKTDEARKNPTNFTSEEKGEPVSASLYFPKRT